MSIINSDGLNTNWQLNVLKGLQAIATEAAKPLNVNVHDGTGIPITSTVVGADKGLDVNIINALPLEINLDAANDQVGIYGYNGTTPTPVSVDSNGFVNTNATITFPSSLSVTQNVLSNPWTVNGTVALDTATLTALENITVQNGAGAAAVNIQDGGNSITVDGIVNVGNFPASIEISNDVGNPVPVSGTVTITDGSGPVTVDGTVAATQSGTWNVNNITGTVSLPTGAATESTLSTLSSQFTAVTRTPALIRTGTSGTIPAGARSISVFNAGAAAGSILGVVGNILPGEVFEFSAGGENDTLAAFAYNGAGTTLVITSIV